MEIVGGNSSFLSLIYLDTDYNHPCLKTGTSLIVLYTGEQLRLLTLFYTP